MKAMTILFGPPEYPTGLFSHLLLFFLTFRLLKARLAWAAFCYYPETTAYLPTQYICL